MGTELLLAEVRVTRVQVRVLFKSQPAGPWLEVDLRNDVVEELGLRPGELVLKKWPNRMGKDDELEPTMAYRLVPHD